MKSFLISFALLLKHCSSLVHLHSFTYRQEKTLNQLSLAGSVNSFYSRMYSDHEKNVEFSDESSDSGFSKS